jgi:ribosomal protein S18 acetylase RimI-like enzyme
MWWRALRYWRCCRQRLGAKPCDELKSEIDAKLQAKGVKSYTLDVVATDAVKDQKVVGSCEAGAKKIVYSRDSATPKADSAARRDLTRAETCGSCADCAEVPMSSARTPRRRRVRRLRSEHGELDGLADLLIDCVDGGASVSFMHPLPAAKALEFWRALRRSAWSAASACCWSQRTRSGSRQVQLLLELPENQPHRADVAKMLVHRRARRRGLGTALLRAAEQRRATAAKRCWCSIRSPAAMPSAFMHGSVGSAAA